MNDTPQNTLQATSYMEINRLHQNTLSAIEGVIMVTAVGSESGTTTLAHLLAQRSAEQNKKVLLIDLNLRNAGLSVELAQERKEWKLPLREPSDLMNDLYTLLPNWETLHFMAAPLDDDSVNFLKDTTRARAFLGQLRKQFDHIVIDTTSISQMNRYNIDPVTLGGAADNTILSIMAKKTSKAKAQNAINMLKDGGANLLGVVVNNHNAPDQRESLLGFISGLRRLMPGLHSWLKYKIDHAEL